MLNTVVVVALVVALCITVFLGVFTLFSVQSTKKSYFLLCMLSASLLILGNILEVLSTTSQEAFTATKVLYLGTFVATFTLFFVADYFDIKLPRYLLKIPLFFVSIAIIVLMWTTDSHHLVYLSYWLGEGSPHYLDFEPGPLYLPLHLYPVVCISASSIMIFYKLFKGNERQRRQLIALLLGVLTPLIAEVVYIVSVALGINEMSVYLTPYFMAAMSIIFYIGIIRFGMLDIVARATELTLDTIAEAYVLIDDQMLRLDANAAACKLFPGFAQSPRQTPVTEAENWPKELTSLDTEQGNYSVSFSMTTDDTRHYTAGIHKVPAENDATAGWIILIQDVTESFALMEQLEEAAHTDVLTSLYNRRHFMELANISLDKAKRFAQTSHAMILDLDFFKQVNDTYGHLAGDEVLRTMSARAQAALRSYDLLGRYGGEEFVVFLTECDMGTALMLAERLRFAIGSTACRYEGTDISITVSIGLAESLPDDTLDDILLRADRALYEAKEHGRNQVAIADNKAAH
jgi:diguanylate cyclase (GGDEF)-like protein